MADRKKLALVAISKNKKEVTGYYLLDTSNFNVCTVKVSEVANIAKACELVNISIDGGKILTNGAAGKYPTFYEDTNKVENVGTLVIVGRMNLNGNAEGFTAWSPKKGIKAYSAKEIEAEVAAEHVANAKLRDGHVSSIKGSFIVCEISDNAREKAKTSKVEADLFCIYTDVNSKTKYVSFIVKCSNSIAMSEIANVLSSENNELIKVLKKTGDTNADLIENIPVNAEALFATVELGTFVKFCGKCKIDKVHTVRKYMEFVVIKSDTCQELKATVDKSGHAEGNKDVLDKAHEDIGVLTKANIKFVIRG